MQVVYLTAFCRLKFIGTIMMKRLAIAPHRLYFFLGTLLILVLFFWWWMQLQHPATMPIPLHAMLMPLGVFPIFFTPRWDLFFRCANSDTCLWNWIGSIAQFRFRLDAKCMVCGNLALGTFINTE